ncbi:FHA domain-containing protein [Halobacteriovorax sp. HLS]|uniref:FHA domain-containing protein n=1 Tax=Halobacteriovorax sp. HLS TaxID=2234000 RepID=UPI0013E37C82|nr:FHA domain-containing protein [Halobacteriovorax sp. HLS]
MFYLRNKETNEITELYDQLTVGRRSKCDLVFKDDLVSGFHCKFHVTKRAIFIEDLKASNPASINGVGIASQDTVKLNHHDVLMIGSTSFIVVDKSKENDASYKTLILDKVKIHETFEEDSNYEENQRFWQNESQTKKKVQKLKAKIKVISESREIIDTLKSEYNELQVSQKEILASVKTPNKYNLDELKEHINHYQEKINELSEKKNEIVNVYNKVVSFKDNQSQIQSLGKRIEELESNFDVNEFEELTKEYESALLELENLKKVA